MLFLLKMFVMSSTLWKRNTKLLMYARELYLKIFLSEINALSLNIKQRYGLSIALLSYITFLSKNQRPMTLPDRFADLSKNK